MKRMFKFLTAAAVLTAATSMAAPQYPFKSYTYPHGNIIKYADDAVIKDHFAKWKKAWMKDVNGQRYVLAPEGTCSTVSEAIAYGMMIMVFMDDGTNGAESDFAALYNTWTQNGGAGGGMNWRIGCDGGTGSASDADFDAAMALAMAGKQWNNQQYTEDAKAIAGWTATNDIDGNNSIKGGSNWSEAFNPSYATLANFRVFKTIGASGNWDAIAEKAAGDLSACQNSTSGLVPDWCDWSSHQPTQTSAAVQQSEAAGFYDDAARTPWRTAWDYYWYGTASSKTFNAKITKWLYTETSNQASAINSGYSWDGKATKTEKRNFASSTFSGGLGFAAASDETDAGMKYIQSVYGFLANKTTCASAEGCGEGTNAGEKYYPATLNMLYLLLITGHMPNFVDMTGFTEFTPDPTLAPSVTASDGVQMTLGDTTVGVSGFWHWGAYHDKLGIGTTMSVDSGASPLFYKADLDQIVAEVSMEIGPEPEWTQEADDAGTLKYPSAGIALSFLPDSKAGIDLQALGVKTLRLTAKVSGPIRIAMLNTITDENAAKEIKNAGAGSEPGIYLEESSDYTVREFDLTPMDQGFVGFDKKNNGGLLSWVDGNKVPQGDEILQHAKGFKFEIKNPDGSAIGDISIKALEFLDASGNVIDPVKITGIAGVASKPAGMEQPASSTSQDPASSGSDPLNPTSSSTVDPFNPASSGGVALPVKVNVAKFQAHVAGMALQISNATAGSDFAVFSMQGKVITSGKVLGSTHSVVLPNKGAYLVRVGSEIRTISVK